MTNTYTIPADYDYTTPHAVYNVDRLSDALLDLSNDIAHDKGTTAATFERNERHEYNLSQKHPEGAVSRCEVCFRGVIVAKAHFVGTAVIGPTCWKRHGKALRALLADRIEADRIDAAAEA